jgi:hypothetical protein
MAGTGYVDPTGRGETKSLESSLPVLNPGRSGNFSDRPKDAAPSGGLGASNPTDAAMDGTVDRERNAV